MQYVSHYIAGEWVEGPDSFTRSNPRTGTEFSRVAVADNATVNRAVSAAHAASVPWAALPSEDRARHLVLCADWLEQQYGKPNEVTDLKQAIMDEIGKPLPEADIEVIETASFIRFFAERAAQALAPEDVRLDNNLWPTKVSRIEYRPFGVVGIIKAWNYPLEIPLWSIAPALLAGNTVVFKPSEKSSAIGAMIGRMAEAVQLPKGVLNIVNGGPDVGAMLVEHPLISMISFTGSVPTGRNVASRCGQLLKKAALELGGNDAAIVTASADPELVANGLVWGAFCNAGQVCVGIKRAYLHEKIASTVIDLVIAKTKALRLGVDVGPIIDEMQLEKVDMFVRDAAAHGGTINVGGARATERPGYFYRPTVITGLNSGMRLASEECFGPVLPIAVVSSEEQAIKDANATSYGLGASVWAGDEAERRRLADEINAGMVWLNDVNVAFAEVPWGGIKSSGIGFELSVQALREYCRPKHISIERGDTKTRVWWYPYGE